MSQKYLQEICKDWGFHKYPKFYEQCSRFRKTFKPSTLSRNNSIQVKKLLYQQQAQFLTSYIIGQKIYQDKKKEIDDI
jgi:hypothetical protein